LLKERLNKFMRKIFAAKSEASGQVGIPVDRDRSFRFVVTGDSGSS